MPPAFRDNFLSDLRLAQTCVRGGHIASDKTARKYRDWMAFCTEMQIDHTLEDPEVPTVEVLQVFGVRVRDGAFSNRVPGVRADTVAAAWRAVAEVHLLEGRPDPRKPPGSSSRDLDKRLTRMLRHWGYQDPHPKERKQSL